MGRAISSMGNSQQSRIQSQSPPLTVDFESRWFHASVLAACLAILLLAMFLRPDGNGKFYIPGTSHVLPELCTAKRMFGWSCPGCGLTRSVVHSAHGRLGKAFQMNPAGPLFFLVFVLQVPWRIWRLVGHRNFEQQSSAIHPVVHFFTGGGFAIVAIVATLVQWVFRPLWS